MQELPKILIVDDDETNLRFLHEVLSEKYQIQSVSTGEEALQFINSFNPNILLLDIMLPGIDGYEVCQKIRKDEKHSEVRIILISAKAMADDKQKGYDMGGDAYITKPFDHLDLCAIIDKILVD